MNGHLAGPGDVMALMHTERVIIALARQPRPEGAGEVQQPRETMRLAIRALAWVGRWQTPAPQEMCEATPKSQTAIEPFGEIVRLPEGFRAGDRSRDGPVALLTA